VEDPTLDAIDIKDISTWDTSAEKYFAYRVMFPSCTALAVEQYNLCRVQGSGFPKVYEP
jgi:hypothetical protein